MTENTPARREATPGGTHRWLAFARRWGVTVLLTVAALATGFSNVAHHGPQFSPFDEWVYYDYLVKVPSQGFVRTGEEIGPEALEAMACDGDAFGPRGEPCTGPDGVYDEPELYPQQGLNSADIYTPAYFWVTRLVADGIRAISGTDLLTAGRAVGPLWLAGAMPLLVLLFRELKVGRLLQLGLGLLLISTPMTHYATTYISTDAPSLLFGALVLTLGLRFARSGTGGWWLAAASVVATLFKVTNILAVGLVVVALLLQLLMGRRPPTVSTVRFITIPIAATVASALAEIAWLSFRSANALGVTADQGLVAPLTLRTIAYNAYVLIAGGRPDATATWPQLLNGLWPLLLIAGVIGWFLIESRHDSTRAWSIATAAAAFLFGPILTIVMAVLMGQVAPLTPRYALALLPMFAAAVAMITRNRLAEGIILAYGIAMFLSSLLTLNP